MNKTQHEMMISAAKMIEHVYKLDNHSIVIIFTTNAIFIFYFFRSLVRFIFFYVRTVNRVSNFKIINSLARKNAKNMFRRGIFIRERACACVNKFACAYVVAESFFVEKWWQVCRAAFDLINWCEIKWLVSARDAFFSFEKTWIDCRN